jgi:hypothetical protein
MLAVVVVALAIEQPGHLVVQEVLAVAAPGMLMGLVHLARPTLGAVVVVLVGVETPEVLSAAQAAPAS